MRITKNKVFAAIIIVLVVLAATVWYFGVFSIKPDKTSDAQNTKTEQEMAPSQDTPNSKYATLKGDAYDEAFIADMLALYEGTSSMSEQASAVTAHEEIRTYAQAVMQTEGPQTMELRDWQKAWGYKITMSGGHMSHGGGGMQMAGDMVESMNKLKDLTGAEYDKEFLKQMIAHREQSVEMSQYAASNAKHQEIKDLASTIAKSHKNEIGQMKQWQESWSY